MAMTLDKRLRKAEELGLELPFRDPFRVDALSQDNLAAILGTLYYDAFRAGTAPKEGLPLIVRMQLPPDLAAQALSDVPQMREFEIKLHPYKVFQSTATVRVEIPASLDRERLGDALIPIKNFMQLLRDRDEQSLAVYICPARASGQQ